MLITIKNYFYKYHGLELSCFLCNNASRGRFSVKISYLLQVACAPDIRTRTNTASSPSIVKRSRLYRNLSLQQRYLTLWIMSWLPANQLIGWKTSRIRIEWIRFFITNKIYAAVIGLTGCQFTRMWKQGTYSMKYDGLYKNQNRKTLLLLCAVNKIFLLYPRAACSL